MPDIVRKPNILWICTDQQRFDTLGCYGNSFVTTPNIDQLAREGALFRNAFCQSPVCTPSRGSFLTGRYPATCGTPQNGTNIPDNEVLISKILHDNGYRCGLAGKLHLSTCSPESGCTEMERRINDGYDEFHWSHDPRPIWGDHNEYTAWLSRKGLHFDTPNRSDCRWIQTGMPEEHHQTTWCVDKTVDFIRSYAGSPWLFSVNIFDPHHPFDPPTSYLNPYLEKLHDIPLPNYIRGELRDKSAWHKEDSDGAYGHKGLYPFTEMSDDDHRLIKAACWAMCDLIDVQVGRMLNALEQTGQAENTIVIFTTDHGEMLGDHGVYLKGPYFYEGTVHVPLIMRWPKGFSAAEYQSFVELVDLPQTLLDFIGLKHHPGMQGKSFAGMLNGFQPDDHRSSVYCEYQNSIAFHREPSVWSSTMVQNKRFKIVKHHTSEFGELYDLLNDPHEQRNLWSDSASTGHKVRMLELLADRISLTRDPLPEATGSW